MSHIGTVVADIVDELYIECVGNDTRVYVFINGSYYVAEQDIHGVDEVYIELRERNVGFIKLVGISNFYELILNKLKDYPCVIPIVMCVAIYVHLNITEENICEQSRNKVMMLSSYFTEMQRNDDCIDQLQHEKPLSLYNRICDIIGTRI
jgi:hypothetical protein